MEVVMLCVHNSNTRGMQHCQGSWQYCTHAHMAHALQTSLLFSTAFCYRCFGHTVTALHVRVCTDGGVQPHCRRRRPAGQARHPAASAPGPHPFPPRRGLRAHRGRPSRGGGGGASESRPALAPWPLQSYTHGADLLSGSQAAAEPRPRVCAGVAACTCVAAALAKVSVASSHETSVLKPLCQLVALLVLGEDPVRHGVPAAAALTISAPARLASVLLTRHDTPLSARARSWTPMRSSALQRSSRGRDVGCEPGD